LTNNRFLLFLGLGYFWVGLLDIFHTQTYSGMSIYDPTAGSGGMLIQSYQYVEDQGQNPSDLEMHGQELDPTVVAICKMNIILHNITNYHIEFGDTLEEPLNVGDGKLLSFDRVIANPPFSQNYNTAAMQYKSRFGYGFAPETGKKADRMSAAWQLSHIKRDPLITRGLVNALAGGRDEDVLHEIISALGHLADETSIAALVSVLANNKNPQLRRKSAWALSNMKKSDKALGALEAAMLSDSDDIVHVLCAE